ncbi:hypothetical protein H310_02435 [Aphanomyces invadans]|uniref:Uncharacterized protein n=1 Tax=Aphanomyces invadans TaxID=157072 RepID=A0A024UP37_9STRA|nr:hypothetical protein H310_02435 [Aphanomyces invadans]ETW08069.1 hypothetical protein H310_02435 [Aphanomyces invadans]|eukprot:XP_008864162.1 hypothetical protein H310_02435 [Aphanomyces invadans]
MRKRKRGMPADKRNERHASSSPMSALFSPELRNKSAQVVMRQLDASTMAYRNETWRSTRRCAICAAIHVSDTISKKWPMAIETLGGMRSCRVELEGFLPSWAANDLMRALLLHNKTLIADVAGRRRGSKKGVKCKNAIPRNRIDDGRGAYARITVASNGVRFIMRYATLRKYIVDMPCNEYTTVRTSH